MIGQDPDRTSKDAAPGKAESRDLFERAVDQLDAATSNRLRLLRREALASASVARPGKLAWSGAGAAAALLLGLAWWSPWTTGPTPTTAPEVAEATDTVFPLEDDAELYAWLADAPVAVDPPGGSL